MLADITISGGRQDGVVANDSGDLTLSSVTVTASEQDGVKFDSRGSDLTIIDSTIDDNLDDGIYVGAADAVTVTGSSSSDNGDSGLYADDRPIGSFTVTDSTLDRNDSPGFYIDTSLGDVVITGSSISDNDDSGLNFYNIFGGVTITDTTISNNNGDGLYADYIDGDLSIVGSTISGNTDNGIEIDESLFGDLIVTGTTFYGNDDNAIDVSTADGAVEISDTTISNNVDVGLYLRNGADGALTITDSTFDANGAAVRIDDEVDGDVNISRSAFTNGVDDDAIVIDDVSGNTVIDEVTVADNGDDPTDVALDVAATDGSVVVSNSTFSGNAGPSVAGPTVGSLDIVNSTFTANAGDAVVAAGGLTSIQHSTISGNTPTIAAVSSVDGAVTLDHTVATDNGAVPFFAATGTGSATTSFSMLPTGSAIGTGDVESDAPLLGPLADNGGETETLFPQPGSPVVDAGDPAISGEPEFDQRGVGREADVNRVDGAACSCSDEVPQRWCANRVDDEVDPVAIAWVDHVVPTECVEDPALAGRHVDAGTTALEFDVIRGDDRDMDADPVEPVEMRIEVWSRLSTRFDPHEPGSTDGHAKRSNRLREERAGPKPRGRRLTSSDRVVGVIAVSGYEADRSVAFVAGGMTAPGIAGKRIDFLNQLLRFEPERQFHERLSELHPTTT